MLQFFGRYSLPRVAVLLLVLLVLSPGAAPAAHGAPAAPALPVRSVVAFPTAGFSLCFPYAPKQAGGSAILAITNPNATAAVLQVNYTKPDGSAGRTPQVLNLGPGATALLDLAEDAALPAGGYQVIAASTSPLSGLALVRSATGSLGPYGAVDCAAPPDTIFGPFFAAGATGGSSTLAVLNSAPAATTYQLDFLNNAGAVVHTTPVVTVAPGGSLLVASADVPAGIFRAEGFGRVQVNAGPDGKAHGVLAIERSGRLTFANALFTRPGTAAQASAPLAGYINSLPRLHNRSTEAGGPFTTELLLATTEIFTNTVNISFYQADGTMFAPPIVAMVPPGGARYYKAILESQATGIPSVVIGSQGALAVQADTVAPDAPAADGAYVIAGYVAPIASSKVVIPGVIRSGSTFSVVAAQNTTGVRNSVTIDFLDLDGSVVFSQQRELPAGAAFSVDVRSTGLPESYIGTARISGSANVVAQLDIYSQMAFPPLAEVAISGQTVTTLGASVELTATAAPAGVRLPITYTWQVAESPDRNAVVAGLENRQTFAWAEPGLKKVRVVAYNGASAVVAEHSVRVPAVTATAGSEPLTLVYAPAPANSVQLLAPVDAVPSGSQLALTPLSREQVGALYGPPAAATLLGLPVLMEAVADGAPLPGFAFAAPAALLMHYDNAGLTVAQETELRIWTVIGGKWVDAATTCDPAAQYTRRPDLNEIEVQICHLSPYAVGFPGRQLYLPALHH